MQYDTFTAKKRTAVIRRPAYDQLVQRESDDLFFEASNPGYPAYSQIFTGPEWFFRCVERLPNKWWRGERWKRTGEVWITKYHRGWSIAVLD